jgi:hypothetical protein
VNARTSEARTPRSNRLPGNEELFRPTGSSDERTAVAEVAALTPGIRSLGGGLAVEAPAEPADELRPSGRERHDEKITVYVSSEELLRIEEARLALRRDHALKVDRGRIVRAALVEVLADLDRLGPDSPLVARLREA